MQNKINVIKKRSDVSRMTDRYILVTILMQFVLCIVAGISNTKWVDNYGQYLEYLVNDVTPGVNRVKFGKDSIYSIAEWFVCLANFVPITLIVTLEIVKVLQGLFLTYDVGMIHSEKK